MKYTWKEIRGMAIWLTLHFVCMSVLILESKIRTQAGFSIVMGLIGILAESALVPAYAIYVKKNILLVIKEGMYGIGEHSKQQVYDMMDNLILPRRPLPKR